MDSRLAVFVTFYSIGHGVYRCHKVVAVTPSNKLNEAISSSKTQ
jgi:hypothetical protein